MIEQNSSSETKPSLSRSAFSIIAWSSFSEIYKFNYFANLLRFFVETKPAFSSSNNENTFFTVFLVILTPELAVMISKNVEKSSVFTFELFELHKSEMIWKRVELVCQKPCNDIVALSSIFIFLFTFWIDDSSSIGIEEIKGLF